MIFADADNQAHARRRAHRQSALSAVREDTTAALIVAEAFHQTARTDVSTLLDVLALELESFRAAPAAKTFLSKISPSFEY